MEDRLSGIQDGRWRLVATALLLVAALLLAGGIAAAPADAKGGKKIRACVTKRGPDKGAMRFSRSGKCHKGEKKISWKKKGKPGPAGPQGPSGITDSLLETITQQQQTIETLTTQVNTLTTQVNTLIAQLNALTSTVNGLSPRVAALCSQMAPATSRINAFRTVINGITLAGTIPIGLLLDVPNPPAALPAPFSCP
jgi:outer membrane murein-binding lipoprotein Lpp